MNESLCLRPRLRLELRLSSTCNAGRQTDTIRYAAHPPALSLRMNESLCRRPSLRLEVRLSEAVLHAMQGVRQIPSDMLHTHQL